MAYIPPSSLEDIPQELMKVYQGKNPRRWSMLALYAQIANDVEKEKKEWMLIGLGVFIFASIKQGEYDGSSPKIGWFGGSHFYTLFKQLFNIHKKNPLSHEERLFYLYEVKKFLNEAWTDAAFERLTHHVILKTYQVNLIWKTKKELLEDISKTFDAVQNKNEERLHQIIHSLPVLPSLIKSMQSLENNHYANSTNIENVERIKQINCIRFINATLKQCNTTTFALHVCASALTHIALDIKIEYSYYEWLGWTAEHSALFREILKALNKKNIDEIVLEEKILWFKDLRDHFVIVLAHPGYKNILNALATNTKDLTVQELDLQIKNFQQAVSKRLEMFEAVKSTPSYASQIIATTTSYGLQWGLSKASAEITKKVVVCGLSMGGLFAAGPVGYAMFGTAGTLLMSGLSYLVSDDIITAVSAKLFAYLIAKIGDAAGDAAAKAASFSYSITPAGLEEIRKNLKYEDDMVFVRWVNTLLELETISSADKQHMRAVLNLKEDEKLQPISNMTLSFLCASQSEMGLRLKS